MMILDKIVEQKKQEVLLLLRQGIIPPVIDVPPPRGFQKTVADYDGLAIIAEVKKASPSKGIIRPDFEPLKIAQAYQQGGAPALSVLTDQMFFQGLLDYIPLIRQAVTLPVLRKDFIIHQVQIEQARIYGADAILLIAAILDGAQLRDYLAMALEQGIDVLVEVHDEYEVEKSLNSGAQFIGINNRDLRDFSVDLELTFRLQRFIPAEIPLVSESGIRDHHDIERLVDHGIAAVLVGETLMRADDPAQGLCKLISGNG